MDTPVALFIYKRPEFSKRLLEILKIIQPQKLFIFANGPQNDDEIELCNETQEIFDTIEWTKDVYRNYLSTNIGLGNRLISGITYTFSQVDKAIFLEDDCVPEFSFFKLCDELLELYKDEDKIMHINGTNLIAETVQCQNLKESFFFINYSFPWGWASWARAWEKFNPNFDTWTNNKELIKRKISSQNATTWERGLQMFEKGFKESWDMQWSLDIMVHDGLVITPKQNLISNVGIDEASSYMPKDSSYANLKTEKMADVITLPSVIQCDIELNNLYERQITILMNDFLRQGKELKKSREIIKFLAPIDIKENINTFQKVLELLKDVPPYTILPIDFFESMVTSIPKRRIVYDGNWVEIGVRNGGGALFFKALMDDLGVKKHLYLYDTFGMVPLDDIHQQKDKEFVEFIASINKEKQINEDNYKNKVVSLFERFNYNEEVSFIECDVNHYRKDLIPKDISFLHLDVDFYEATYSALNLFYDSILPGGIIIVDDYYMELLNCKEAVDRFLQEQNIDSEQYTSRFSSYAIQIIKPLS